MPLLITSASGPNGDGYGALLAFDPNGVSLGVFCDEERIADPRGLAVHQQDGLLYVNSGQDRILALSARGTVVRDSGQIQGLNPGGGSFGPDGRYYVGLRGTRTVTAFPPTLDAPSEHFLAPNFVSTAVYALVPMQVCTVLRRTRLSPSISLLVSAWAQWCGCLDCTDRRWYSSRNGNQQFSA